VPGRSPRGSGRGAATPGRPGRIPDLSCPAAGECRPPPCRPPPSRRSAHGTAWTVSSGCSPRGADRSDTAAAPTDRRRGAGGLAACPRLGRRAGARRSVPAHRAQQQSGDAAGDAAADDGEGSAAAPFGAYAGRVADHRDRGHRNNAAHAAPSWARVHWPLPAGGSGTGMARVSSGLGRGERATIWLDGRGRPAAQPLSPSAGRLQATVAGAAAGDRSAPDRTPDSPAMTA
jgi:hypothetical protein